MRIAFAGSHGVGKTTLAEWLAKRMELTLIPDLARELRTSGRCPERVKSIEDRAWILWKQIRCEQENVNFISDGSVYAAVVYLLNAGMVDYVDDFEQTALKYGAYDRIFYLPIEIPLKKDYLRSDDIEFQQEIDELYRDFLKSHGIKFIEVKGTLEQRKKKILNYIPKK